MATNAGDDEFDEYKPGAERSRRRRGEDDDLESDLEEGDLLEEDWLSSKKNPSEMSDEELNDDLLQSDEEDQNTSGQGEVVSLNATLGLGTSGHLQDEDPVGGGYTEYSYEETEGGQPGFSQGGEYEGEDEGVEYTGDQNCVEYQDEVLELQIDEPLDDDFQVDDYPTEYSEEQTDRQEVPEEEEHEEETEEQDSSQVTELEEVENENDPEAEAELDADVKEESDEEEEDIEESGRLRFKTERKDDTVVRLSDATSKRRNIPDTLELSDAAKADLREFEERERQRARKQMEEGRNGKRGVIRRKGRRGAGGRGDFPLFGMGGFRGDGVGSRGRINEQRPPLMQVNLGMQQQLRMTPPLQHHHHQSRLLGPRGSGGSGLFPDPGTPIPQQPLQLMTPRLAHHSPGPRAQHDTHVPRLLNSPPRHSRAHPNQHQQHQQHHPKNIHINPHFRGPSSSPVQVPSMPPVQNQPRPNIASQRLPIITGYILNRSMGIYERLAPRTDMLLLSNECKLAKAPPDFQQHLQGNFGPPQRPLPPQDQWRGPPPHHQDPEHFFPGEPRFSGQHMFDQPGPAPLMNNSVLPISGQGPPSFPPQGGLGSPGFGSLGLRQNQVPLGGGIFQREPPRPGLAPQHGGPQGPPGPRGFVGHRQPFSPQQQGPPFSPQHMSFGMQVRQRDPDEDEETRQYRLKIEEQKRLREEILKRKEQRRQMQAGMRKKELMERISGQNPNQTPQTHIPTPNPTPAAQPPQPVPSLISNGTPQNPLTGLSSPRPNVKARLQNTKPLAQTSGWSGPQKQQSAGPDASQQGQWQPQQKITMTPQNTQRQAAAQTSPLEGPLGQPQPGGKRTVMQRASSIESPQVPQKVRVVKHLGEVSEFVIGLNSKCDL
ncbi:hypothetical protein cypCar_00029753 [Cyprinus carpio]|nr:hypothetical protein cypCar_00029753 [Cyprinus carpio]